MRTMLPVLAFLAACRTNDGTEAYAPPQIVLDSPTYGSFHGDGPVQVRGHIEPRRALYGGIEVKVQGEPVTLGPDGTFAADIAFERRWNVIEVEASHGPHLARERVPVFDGHDPLATWPGGATARLTPAALDVLGARLGGLIDATGWDAQIASALPTIQGTGFSLVPTGIHHAPTEVVLAPDLTGIHVGARIPDITLDYVATITWMNAPLEIPVAIGVDEVRVTLLATPTIDDQGVLVLGLGEPQVAIGEPIVQVLDADFEFLEGLLALAVDGMVAPLADTLAQSLSGQLQDVTLGGPFAFDTELMGTPVALSLSELYTDPAGVGAGLGLGIGDAAPAEEFDLPAPVSTAADVHLALGVHEAVFGLALDQLGVLDQLSQDLQLPGTIGEVIGMGIRGLPGGDSAPEGEGWCLALDPNPQDQPEPAQVVRISTDGLDPLATMYLPDLGVSVGIVQGGSCTPWLTASVGAEIGIVVRDTTVSVDFAFVDGAVLDYAATTPWTEDEVIVGLNSYLNGAMGLLGGQLSFDLADLLGGLQIDPAQDPFGLTEGLSPALVGAGPLLGRDGQPVEGMAQLDLRLWE